MKINLKISLVIAAILSLSVTILTLLIHFKYQAMNTNLIASRINVIIGEIKVAVGDNINPNIDFFRLYNIKKIAEAKKKEHPVLENIAVFSIKRDKIIYICNTNAGAISSDIEENVILHTNQTRRNSWNFKVGNEQFVGIFLKNIIGQVIGGIYVSYIPAAASKIVGEEIKDLYVRLIFTIFISVILSFIVGYLIMRPLNTSINTMSENIKLLLSYHNTSYFDMHKIDDGELRRNFIDMHENSQKTLIKFDQIKKWIEDI
ncbi:MAG: hypothetical protein ACTSXG_01185 [Alphaproteobacteria bacterium]